jgi:hypothetical protein
MIDRIDRPASHSLDWFTSDIGMNSHLFASVIHASRILV